MTTGGDIRLSFNQVPEIYDRVRPHYPSALFDRLFSSLPTNADVVEVGPGTGQATAALLSRNARVTAVEIGPDLARLLQEKLGADERLTVVNDDFENVELPTNSFDAVVSATAYHWVDPAAQVDKPLEVLKPGGVLAVIDLIQVASDIDRGYFDRVRPIYEKYGQARQGWTPPTHESAVPRIAEHLETSARFERVDVHTMPWDQSYDAASYRDLLLSYSGTQMMDEPERSAMVNELVRIVETEFGGSLVRPLVAALTLAQTRHEADDSTS